MLPKPYSSSSSSSSAAPQTPPRYGPRPLSSQQSPVRSASVHELALQLAHAGFSAGPPSPDKPLPQLPASLASYRPERDQRHRTESAPSRAYVAPAYTSQQPRPGPWQHAAAALSASSVERPTLPRPPQPQHSSYAPDYPTRPSYQHCVPQQPHQPYYSPQRPTSMPVAGPSRIAMPTPDHPTLTVPHAVAPSRVAMPSAMPYQAHAHPTASSRYRPASPPRQDAARLYGKPTYPNPWELAPPSEAAGGLRPSSAPNSVVDRPSVSHHQSADLAATPAPLRPGSAPTFPDAQRPVATASAQRPPASSSTSTSSTSNALPPLQPDQCAGIKKDGTRCTRKVRSEASKSRASTPRRGATPGKSPSPSKGSRAGSASPTKQRAAGKKADRPIVISDSDDSDVEVLGGSSRSRSPTKAAAAAAAAATTRDSEQEEDAEEAPEYCHQHLAEINRSTTLALPNGAVLPFPSILASLTPRSAARIRACLNKGPSISDRAQRGYIYVYALRDRDTQDSVCLKVGRATRVFERIGQWRKQCGSKDPVLRAFYPSDPGQGLLSGASTTTQQGYHGSHLWERLCHLELLDIGVRLNEPCVDCGTKHREIFLVPRSVGGFERVKELVLRWSSVVNSILDSPA